MALKDAVSGVLDGERWAPVREALEALEQAAAAGWYPARRALLSHLGQTAIPHPPLWVPEADVEQGPGELAVSFALPGVLRGDVRVSAGPQTLTVSGRRREDERAPAVARRELPSGEFLRRVRLPVEVKPASTRAVLKNGVLRVTLARVRASGSSVKIE
ncbi:MAG: Hsp20/alpha crystallin family protein [Elusimicrobia bacterium]|nr:Hsp20/alpha crystallin family protein [Elusimicrobiota bacterium]